MDLHCLQRQGISEFSRTRFKKTFSAINRCLKFRRTFLSELQIRGGIRKIVFLFLHENMLWYSLEVPREALLMSTITYVFVEK